MVIKDLLRQEEVVLLEKPFGGLHLRHELQVQCITHLLPGHPLGHHKGHPVLWQGRTASGEQLTCFPVPARRTPPMCQGPCSSLLAVPIPELDPTAVSQQLLSSPCGPSLQLMALTISEKALSHSTVALALLSWFPWTMTTMGRDRTWGHRAAPLQP